MLMLWVSLVTIGHQTNVLKTTVGPLTSCERVKLAANRGYVGGLRLAVRAWGKFFASLVRLWLVQKNDV